ncbi:zinc finger BED domain-containing protein 4-like [Oreochromis niloticus]|uniref:zinc finger BED domain-containing protein 4-like n=1 Tax=Oreochromis niloticus TaxID=8128 RepID=UPI000904D8B6|nr:zinc finger BED domain-containing protein 4-like [Oreochromis niloticus]
MLKRIAEVKYPLISTLALVNPQLQTLSLEEWEMVKETCEVLQPFEEVTVELSAERFVTGSKAILMARGLQRVTAHRQRSPSIYQPIRNMVDILMAEIVKRLGGIEQVSLLADATLLDPRFKKHAFLHDRHAEDAVTRVVGAASRSLRPLPLATSSTEEGEGVPQANPSTETVPVIWADFEERVASLRPGVQNPFTEAMLEIKGFLSEPLLPRTSDPLEWWKSRATVFKKNLRCYEDETLHSGNFRSIRADLFKGRTNNYRQKEPSQPWKSSGAYFPQCQSVRDNSF